MYVADYFGSFDEILWPPGNVRDEGTTEKERRRNFPWARGRRAGVMMTTTKTRVVGVYVSSKLEMTVATLIISRVQERPYKIWLRTRVDDGGQRKPVSSGHTMSRNKKWY
jgi:hypothetical protein